MVIDIRQHIITIAAIFLALGTGILIGMALVEDRTMVEQQQKLIDRLEADFEELRRDRDLSRAELARAQSELMVSRRFEEQAFYAFAKDKLVGERIAIIMGENSISEKELKSIQKAIEYSGGFISTIIRVRRTFSIRKDDNAGELMALVGKGIDQSNEFAKLLAGDLISAISGAGGFTIVPALEAMGFISVDGESGRSADQILIVGGSRTKLDKEGAASKEGTSLTDFFKDTGLLLAEAAKSQGIRVVVAEASSVTASHMKSYASRRFTTVDSIDTPLGYISLIYALSGVNGHFGVREGATDGVPDIFPGPDSR
ncbi:MAG TPA: copper transporter [Firmicutes bacterium]|nr:copper transporter [Bacillota bacterium]HHY97988.1 copper transporter [Bacillota bacterium]